MKEEGMKTTYEVYRVGQSEPERGEIDWEGPPGYDRIRALVEPLLGAGEPLEHVSVLHNGQRCDMFVSEMGHCALTTRGPLPINDKATAIYRNYSLTMAPGMNPEDLPDIAGTAVLFPGRVVWT
jgi:hypothetical protein